MKYLVTTIIFLISCTVATTYASDLPAWVVQGRPTGARPMSIPGFASINATLKEKGTVRIIARITPAPDLPSGFLPEGSLTDKAAVSVQRAAISRRQDAVLSNVSRKHAAAAKRFDFIPFMALEVDATEFQALASSSEIDNIEEDIPVLPSLMDTVPLIGGAGGAFNGFSGSGQTVAILDTGVDKSHNFLTGKVVSEACFSTTDDDSTAVCGPWGSTASGSGANCSSSYYACDHGTHVAGIAAGSGSTFSGVAKDATIIAVQVFSGFPASRCGSLGTPCVMSYPSDQIAGMQRVYNLRNTFKISSVNMSLGGGQYYSHCDSKYLSTKAAIDALRSVGIATVIASGNEGFSDSISGPACISTAVSVGATTKSDAVANFSNSAEILTLLAPGAAITSSVPGGTFESWNGTSMATPHVAGAWAVLKSAKPNASVDRILNALVMTGVPVNDTDNSIVKPRIELDDAIRVILSSPRRMDFDGDGKSDIAVWRANNGGWFVIPSSGPASYMVPYGVAGDKLVPADYDGDGKTDVAVWRPSSGTWYISKSSTGTQIVKTYGTSTDRPVPGDYDGDGKSDLAVWRPSSGTWYISKSSTGTQIVKTYGTSTDRPIPGDYDGDGRSDLAVWRPSSGAWYISYSSSGAQFVKTYGVSSDVPTPGDYDDDGKTDIAVWRPSNGTWYISNSSTGAQIVKAYGASSDVPIPGDYDGDGKSDLAVWRPSNGSWYISYSATGLQIVRQWGEPTDQPINSE